MAHEISGQNELDYHESESFKLYVVAVVDVVRELESALVLKLEL